VTEVVRQVIRRGPEHCFAAFCDTRRLRSWVPGLRRARLVRAGADGLPQEVLFEFGEARTYALKYSYQVAQRLVAWAPSTGASDAVRGFASFSEHADGCEMTYSVEAGPGRTPDEALLSDARSVVASFTKWIERGPK
jgi:hypothetical protein